MISSPVSGRGSTPELSTPPPTLAAPLLSPLCADPKAWALGSQALDLTTPGGIHLRFTDRSPSCSPKFSEVSPAGSEEAFSGWLMADGVADGLRDALPGRASPQGCVEGSQAAPDAGANELASRAASGSCQVMGEGSEASPEQGGCQLDLRGAFDSDPVPDSWLSGCPASREHAVVGAAAAAPCNSSGRDAALEIPLVDASPVLDIKQDSLVPLCDSEHQTQGAHSSPEKFSIDRVTSGLCSATVAADLTAFLNELEGGCASETPTAHGSSAPAPQQAPYEPFPGVEEEEEGTLQDALGALVGTMSHDGLAEGLVDSLVDVRHTTPFSATSSSNSHSVRGASPVSSWEGEGDASLGYEEHMTWTLSTSDLGMLQGAPGGAETLRAEDIEHLDDSWIDCLLDTEAFSFCDDAAQDTVQEPVEREPKGALLPLPGAASVRDSVRDSVREAVRDAVGLSRCDTGLALGGGPPALAPALRAAVARLALDAARTKALKSNKASDRQAVLRASAALESAISHQEAGIQSSEEGAAAVRRALIGRLTTWRQALGIPGGLAQGGSSMRAGTPGASGGSAPLSASQRAAHLRRAVALAKGKQWPPSEAAPSQGGSFQGAAGLGGSASEEGTSKETGAPGGTRVLAPAPVPLSGTPLVLPDPVSSQGGSLRDRIKSLLGEAARPQRSPSPPASGASSWPVLSSGAAPPSGTLPLSRASSSVAGPMMAAVKEGEGAQEKEKEKEREQEQRRSVESAVLYLTRKRSCPGGYTSQTSTREATSTKAARQGLETSPTAAARRAQLLAAATLSATGAQRGHVGRSAEGLSAIGGYARGVPVRATGRSATAAVATQSLVGVDSGGILGSGTSASTALAAAMGSLRPAVPGLHTQKKVLGNDGTSGSLPARLALLARDVQRRQPLL